ncbi:G patch domain-containing protein 11-like [Impatiens glandulifera]|uniref:G patch domain-containing protein 11-like n=1 Tax=Impatiens glandulifera TaxID=253017 RepID=UPI001FB078DB|nr:G patch domain-containing protein 11-like [Impatiens glandulifera]
MTTTQDKNALSSEAPLVPVTVERNVRSDLDTTLPKPFLRVFVLCIQDKMNHQRCYNSRQGTNPVDTLPEKVDVSIEMFLRLLVVGFLQKPTENVDLDNVEQTSLNTQLSSSNIGFRFLQKMGWKGKGFGKDEQGIIEPIRFGMRDAKLGVGKQEEDDFYTAEENIQRKKLDVELEETEEIDKKREVQESAKQAKPKREAVSYAGQISNSSSTKKKAKIPIASVFGNDSDEEQ